MFLEFPVDYNMIIMIFYLVFCEINLHFYPTVFISDVSLMNTKNPLENRITIGQSCY